MGKSNAVSLMGTAIGLLIKSFIGKVQSKALPDGSRNFGIRQKCAFSGIKEGVIRVIRDAGSRTGVLGNFRGSFILQMMKRGTPIRSWKEIILWLSPNSCHRLGPEFSHTNGLEQQSSSSVATGKASVAGTEQIVNGCMGTSSLLQKLLSNYLSPSLHTSPLERFHKPVHSGTITEDAGRRRKIVTMCTKSSTRLRILIAQPKFAHSGSVETDAISQLASACFCTIVWRVFLLEVICIKSCDDGLKLILSLELPHTRSRKHIAQLNPK